MTMSMFLKHIYLPLLLPSFSLGFTLPSPQIHSTHTKYTQTRRITYLRFTNTHVLAPGIELIDAQNDELYNMLQELREEPYFKLYSVDMLGSCEYMPQQLFECSSETCEIYPVDDEEVQL